MYIIRIEVYLFNNNKVIKVLYIVNMFSYYLNSKKTDSIKKMNKSKQLSLIKREYLIIYLNKINNINLTHHIIINKKLIYSFVPINYLFIFNLFINYLL